MAGQRGLALHRGPAPLPDKEPSELSLPTSATHREGREGLASL